MNLFILTFLLLALVLVLLVVLIVRTGRDAPDRAALARLQTRDADYQEATRLLREQ